MRLPSLGEALRSAPYVLLGGIIGWSMDFTCLCRGVSMMPTLNHDDRICFIPYSLLVFKKLWNKALVQPNDIVVVKVSDNVCICKRVTKTTTLKAEAEKWGTEHFDDINPSYYLHEWSPNENGHDKEQESKDRLPRQKPTRSRDWDNCIDRVTHATQWLWLEGDNHRHSHDSRHCGSVPVECLRGKVIGVLWPNTRLTNHLPP